MKFINFIKNGVSHNMAKSIRVFMRYNFYVKWILLWCVFSKI